MSIERRIARFPLLVLLATVACTGGTWDGPRGMGEECNRSADCSDNGVCLKGVCSGYGCTSDGDCDAGLVCDTVAETQVCLAECQSDEDCLGEQTCTTDPAETGEAAGTFCL